MLKAILLTIGLALVAGAGQTSAARPEPEPEILGIRIGMSADEAHARLRKLGRLEKEERKQQEVWVLGADARFAYLIVGFDKGYGQVRYVTAKAREGGTRVRYNEVLELEGARRIVAPPKYEYIREVAAKGERPAYLVIAQGSDPQVLTYYSVKKKE
jgi:hypothetical protein